MDPDANLEEQRRLAAHILWALENDRSTSPNDAHHLAELDAQIVSAS